MKAINTTVQQAVTDFTDLVLLGAFVSGHTGEQTADGELVIKSGQVVRAVKNDSEWPALITIKTDETPPQEVHFYETECISIIFPDEQTAYFKNLAAELQDYIDSIDPEHGQTAEILKLKQELKVSHSMHIDHDRYKWEQLGFGSVDDLVCHYQETVKKLDNLIKISALACAEFPFNVTKNKAALIDMTIHYAALRRQKANGGVV